MVDMVWDTVDTGADIVDTTAVDTMDMDIHTGMDMVDTDMDVDTTEVTTDIHTDTDTDTTVERDLLMLNQKQKLPLIQVPGTDMVDTTATHTDMVDTTEDIHTDTEVTTAVDTTGVRF